MFWLTKTRQLQLGKEGSISYFDFEMKYNYALQQIFSAVLSTLVSSNCIPGLEGCTLMKYRLWTFYNISTLNSDILSEREESITDTAMNPTLASKMLIIISILWILLDKSANFCNSKTWGTNNYSQSPFLYHFLLDTLESLLWDTSIQWKPSPLNTQLIPKIKYTLVTMTTLSL